MSSVRSAPRPLPADFRSPPSQADRSEWAEADRAARPARLARVRERLVRDGLDAYFGVRPENTRYLTGFALRDGEEKVAGHSGQFFVGGEEVVVLADSRYTIQTRREAPDARISVVRRRDEIETRFGDFFDLHRRSRVGKERFMDARMEKFFRRVLGDLADAGGAALWFLDLPSGPAAAFVVLEWEHTVGLYNSGFHPDRATLAPGLVLLVHLVEDAIVRGKRRFDFLRGEERYKYEFGPTAEEVFGVRVEPAKGSA